MQEANKLIRELQFKNIQLREKQSEIDNMQDTVDSLNRSHNEQIEKMKLHFQFLKSTAIEREIKELSNKYQLEIQSRDNQIHYLKQKLAELDKKYKSEQAKQTQPI